MLLGAGQGEPQVGDAMEKLKLKLMSIPSAVLASCKAAGRFEAGCEEALGAGIKLLAESPSQALSFPLGTVIP